MGQRGVALAAPDWRPERLVIEDREGGAEAVPVQRSPGHYDENGLDLVVSLNGTSVIWFFASSSLSAELQAFLSEDPSRVESIETAIDTALHDEEGVLHESPVYLESPAMADRLRRDLLSWASTAALPEFSGWLARRSAARKATSLLYTIEQDVEADGIDPGSIDWERELEALEAKPPIESLTVIDASMLDRYAHVLSIVRRETAGQAGDPSVDLHTETLADVIWNTYVDTAEPPPELDAEFVRLHSEAFLETWLPPIEEARFVPEDFDLEAIRPPTSDDADEERRTLIATYLEGPAQPEMQIFLLDRWAGDPLSRSTESYLATIDLESLRNDLLDHLAESFMQWAIQDDSYRLAFWDAAARQTAFEGIAAVVLAGRSAEAYNTELRTLFATVGPEDLDEDGWKIATDPAGYADTTVAAAASTRDLLSDLRPGHELETSLAQWYQRAFATLPGADADEALAFGGLAALFRGLANLGEVIEGQTSAAREDLRDQLDVGYDDIADVIGEQATFADTFIEDEWLPMLRLVALERVTENKEQLEAALGDWPAHRAQAAAKFRICVHVLDDMIEKLESGDYESMELDGETITATEVEPLWVAREFCAGQAEALEDAETSEETRDQMQEAVDGFETVRANIESGEYEPIDYASAVYDEARARLGLDWYSDYTTLRSALNRQEIVPENPFLAYAIASWQWNESVREMDELAAVFVGLGLLTVAALVVPGVAGIVLGGIDLAVGLAAGIENVDDAYDLLALARLDTDGTIRGVSVEQAEEALNTAWLNLGLTIALTAGVGVLFGRLLIRGRAAAAVPGELVRVNALMKVDAVAAERIISRIKDPFKAEEMLELAGDSRLLQQMLDKTTDVRHLEYLLMSGEPVEVARLLELAGDAGGLARVLDHVPSLVDAARLVEALDDPAQLGRLLDRLPADRLLGVLDDGAAFGELERLFTVLDDLPPPALSALEDGALARFSASEVVTEIEAVAELQEAGRIAGLEDWVIFNGRKSTSELAEAVLELRDARRLSTEHPDGVVRMGRERHAPERSGRPGERMREFDNVLEGSGGLEKSVEVTSVDGTVTGSTDFTRAVRHATDKAASRIAEGSPITGSLEVSIYHRLGEGRSSLGRGRYRVIDRGGNVRIETLDATGAVRHSEQKPNIYDDLTVNLERIQDNDLLQQVTLVDETTGIVRVYLREGAGWSGPTVR